MRSVVDKFTDLSLSMSIKKVIDDINTNAVEYGIYIRKKEFFICVKLQI